MHWIAELDKIAVHNNNLQETETPVWRNKKSKQSRERFYTCIGIAKLDKMAVQNKNIQEKETPVKMNKKTKNQEKEFTPDLELINLTR